MYRRLLGMTLALAAALLMLAGAPNPALADPRDFTLVNGSAVTLREVYVSTSDTRSWEEDILGKDVLDPGASVNIHFPGSDSDAGKCMYDIRVVGVNGAEGVMTSVNLCTTSTVTFS